MTLRTSRSDLAVVRRRRALGAAALLVAGGLAVSVSGSARPGVPARALVGLGGLPQQIGPAVTGATLESTPAGPEDAIGGIRPTISDDARLVAFVGPRSDDDVDAAVAEQTSSSEDRPVGTAYLRDRETGTLVDLLPVADGQRLGDTAAVVVSSDGCSVTVLTQLALDLFDDDDEGQRWDVYRAAFRQCRPRDLTVPPVADPSALVWELVSADEDGRARNDVDVASAPSVSAAGTVVGYVVPVAPRSPLHRVLVTDLTVPVGEAGRTVEVPGLPDTPPTDGAEHVGQIEPAVSGDGTTVAFTTDADASSTPPAWREATRRGGDAVTQVFTWDRTTDEVTLVSATTAATTPRRPSGGAAQPAISGDGTTVAFVATARDRRARSGRPPRSGTSQVFVHRADADRDGTANDPVVELVSRRSGDATPVEGGNGPSWRPSLSADGTTLAFLSRANDLVPARTRPGRARSDGDVIVADLVDGGLRRVSFRPDGARPTRAAHSSPALSANGRVVTFDTSAAAEMVPGAPRTRERQVMAVSMPVSLSLPELDAGTTPPGWPSAEWYVTVSNAGPSTFVPRIVQSDDDRFAVTGGTCIGARVPSGGTCTVEVVFTPTGPGDVVAELTVAESGFRAAEVSTTLTGSGGEPALSATPAGVSFPSTAVGDRSAPVSLEVRNVGWYPATVAQMVVGGAHPEDVQVVASQCDGRVLFPDEVCTVDVAFTPTSAGVRAALVTFVTTTGSRTSALVSGTASHRPGFVTMDEVRAGQTIDALGWGYPADTVVVVAWADGSGRSVAVETDRKGEFVARLRIHERERPGRRVLVVSDPSGNLPMVSSPVLVRPGR